MCGLLGANHVLLFQETLVVSPFWATLTEHSPTSLQRSPHAAAPHLKIWEFCRDEYRRCMQLLKRCLTHFLRVSRSFIQITLKVCKHKINDISFPNNLQLPQNLWPVTIAQEINSLANGHVSAFTSQDWMHPPPPSKLWDGDMAREDQRKIRNTSNSLLKICELWKSIDIWKRKKRFHNLTSIPTSTMSWDRPMKAA